MEKKVILAMGASSGIGHATVRRLELAGHTVYGFARRLKEMEDLKRDNVRILGMDITNRLKAAVQGAGWRLNPDRKKNLFFTNRYDYLLNSL